jgi:hypothetical protein
LFNIKLSISHVLFLSFHFAVLSLFIYLFLVVRAKISYRVLNHCFERNEFDQILSVYSETFKGILPSKLQDALNEDISRQLCQNQDIECEASATETLKEKSILLLLDGFNFRDNNGLCDFVSELLKRPAKKLRLVITSRLPPLSSTFPPVIH